MILKPISDRQHVHPLGGVIKDQIGSGVGQYLGRTV